MVDFGEFDENRDEFFAHNSPAELTRMLREADKAYRESTPKTRSERRERFYRLLHYANSKPVPSKLNDPKSNSQQGRGR